MRLIQQASSVFTDYLPQITAQHPGCVSKGLSDYRILSGQISQHAGFLGSLSGKHKADFLHIRYSLVCLSLQGRHFTGNQRRHIIIYLV